MSPSPEPAGELLRARGLRSTPQRRAILGVFAGGRTEHLAADEVHARASRLLPDLSRATVYATLAEFSELGLVAAFGSPEPVRYETHLEPHAHFRCRLCLRVFDLAGGQPQLGDMAECGFVVERIETRAEGICEECTEYDAGLRAGADAMLASGPSIDALSAPGAAVTEIESALGQLLLAASPQGLTRVAFEDHGDVAALRAHASRRRGAGAARRQLAEASASLRAYLSGELSCPAVTVDWERLAPGAPALMATQAIPYASSRSYSSLEHDLGVRDLGELLGRNPVPILMPCHRVRCGAAVPAWFVGGPARRAWLEAHERTHRGS